MATASPYPASCPFRRCDASHTAATRKTATMRRLSPWRRPALPSSGSVGFLCLAAPSLLSASRRRRHGGPGSRSLCGVRCSVEVSGDHMAGNWRGFQSWVPVTQSRTSEPPPPARLFHIPPRASPPSQILPSGCCRVRLLRVLRVRDCCIDTERISSSVRYYSQHMILSFWGSIEFPLSAANFTRVVTMLVLLSCWLC